MRIGKRSDRLWSLVCQVSRFCVARLTEIGALRQEMREFVDHEGNRYRSVREVRDVSPSSCIHARVYTRGKR